MQPGNDGDNRTDEYGKHFRDVQQLSSSQRVRSLRDGQSALAASLIAAGRQSGGEAQESQIEAQHDCGITLIT
jgi:hypothetical protein